MKAENQNIMDGQGKANALAEYYRVDGGDREDFVLDTSLKFTGG